MNPSQSPLPVERRYVPAADVCKACGLSLSDVENYFRPDDWASPRDFRFARRGMLYAVGSLPRLAASFDACGKGEAARLLRTYAAQLPPDAAGPEEVGKLVQVESVDAGPDELDAEVARLRKRHASDREQLPAGWVHTWEEAHG